MWLDSAEGFTLRQEPVSDHLEDLQRQLTEQRVSFYFDSGIYFRIQFDDGQR